MTDFLSGALIPTLPQLESCVTFTTILIVVWTLPQLDSCENITTTLTWPVRYFYPGAAFSRSGCGFVSTPFSCEFTSSLFNGAHSKWRPGSHTTCLSDILLVLRIRSDHHPFPSAAEWSQGDHSAVANAWYLVRIIRFYPVSLGNPVV